MHLGRALWFLPVCLLLAASPAAAEDAVVRWLVPADAAIEDWCASAETTWPQDRLRVEAWTGAWPPELETHPDDPLVAFLDGSRADGSVVLLSSTNPPRRVQVGATDSTELEPRRRVLLILRSMVREIEVADEGWLPESVEVVAATARDSEAATRITMASREEARRKARVLVEGSLGMTARYGLDSPAFAPALRLGIQLGSFPQFRLLLATEISADFLGRADIDEAQVLFNGASFLVGNELRLGGDRVCVPIRVGIGGRLLWVHRVDRQLRQAPAIVPTVRGGVGVGWSLGPGVQLVSGIILGADLIAGSPPILLVSGDHPGGSTRSVSQLLIGGQVGIALGNLLQPVED